MLPEPSQPPLWPACSGESLFFADLYHLLERHQGLNWQPFFPGVSIHWLYRQGEHGPAAAFIQFQPGAQVPMHEHLGFEHILVLRGSQVDQNGHLQAGGLVVHAPGTRHNVRSDEGCLVLAIYEKRGRFVE